MLVCIHRGSEQIGGSCVELSSGGSRIILDVGMALPKPGEKNLFPKRLPTIPELVRSGILLDVKGLYAHEKPGVDAVVISHAHLDHWGLAPFVHPGIPLYMSEGTSRLLDVNRVFMPGALPLVSERVILEKNKPTAIGGFTVTARLVDHSAPDALALEVEAGGRRVFYSGDLRAHGRKGTLFEKMVQSPPPGIDAMLLEGTTLGGGHGGKPWSEKTVENKLVEVLRGQRNATLLFCSGQNLDRLVTAYRAAIRAGKVLVIDLYAAWVLRQLSVLSNRLPQYDWESVKVKYDHGYAGKLISAGEVAFVSAVKKTGWIREEEMRARRADLLLLARSNHRLENTVRKLGDLDGVTLVWSLWEGYWNGSQAEALATRYGFPKVTLHAGGHASAGDLQRLVRAINSKIVVPIHTEAPERYDELFANVRRVADGESIAL